jgi:hypothetical protein
MIPRNLNVQLLHKLLYLIIAADFSFTLFLITHFLLFIQIRRLNPPPDFKINHLPHFVHVLLNSYLREVMH